MGIRNELDRIKGAKDALKTAIEGKGVTVPSATLIDGYPALVDSIDTSGIDTSDATATAADLLYGQTAYVDGEKITGEGAHWQYVTMVPSFRDLPIALPDTITLHTPRATGFSAHAFNNILNIVSEVEIHTAQSSASTPMNMSYAFYNAKTTKIVIRPYTVFVNNMADCFRGSLIEEMDCEFDFSAITSGDTGLWNQGNMREFRVVPSTMKVNFDYRGSPHYSTASLISIANGLDAASPATLSLHATSKTNCASIMVDNNAGTAEPGSAMSLTSFITTVKGWTIA